MKKMFSLALALIMALALAVPAMAASTDNVTGSIEIGNADAAETYTAYKIFDVTYDDNGAFAYTIKDDSPWYAIVNTYANGKSVDGVDVDGLILTAVPKGDTPTVTTYVVSTTDAFSAPEFAGFLRAQMPASMEDGVEIENGKAENLALGYWFVTSTMGSLCNLTTTTPNAVIYDKNDVPFNKDADDESVEVGQTVNFVITAAVPDVTGYDEYIYTITDEMSAGLTFNKDVEVVIYYEEGNRDDCVVVAGRTQYTENGFSVTIPKWFFTNVANIVPGSPIEVTYSAIVNDAAVAVVSENEATLTYSNDPANNTTTTVIDKEYFYSAEIVIDKYDGTGLDASATEEDIAAAKRLDGAEFVLYKEVAGAKMYYKYTAADGVEWVEKVADATVKTTIAGAAKFAGLENGTYQLLEVKAPTGYNLLTAPVEVTIAAELDDDRELLEGEIVACELNLSLDTQVANNTGVQLPSTGGVGTTIFYTVGGVMMAAAVVLFVTKKKLAVQE